MKYLLFISILCVALSCSSQEKAVEESTATTQQTGDAPTTNPIQNVDVDQFKVLMEGENVVTLDVRTPKEVAAGKIEGALEINVLDPNFQSQIQDLDKDKTYLVYCKAGSRSEKACNLMAYAGFKNLVNLEGGYTAWEASEQ